MNYYSIPPLVTSILFLLLGSFCLFRGKRKDDVFPFASLCFVTVVWQFTWFVLFNTFSSQVASILVKIGYTGIIFIPITYFHFMVNFLKIQNYRSILMVFYGLGFIFVFLLWTTNYFVNGYYKYYWGYYPKANFIHPFHLLQVFIVTIWMLYLLGTNIKHVKSNPVRYNQLKYVILGILFYFPAASDYIVNYGIEFYPIGFIFISIFAVITTYAITRYHLLEIEVIIKKTVVFAGMFAFVFGVVVAVAMLVAQLLGGANNVLSLLISALIITFTLRPLELWLINTTDRFLFQKKYEYKQILKTFINEVITVLNLDEVVNSTLKLLDQTLHPYTSSIFILNKVEDKYQLYSSRGLEVKDIIFTSDSKLITFLKNTKDPAVIKQIDGIVGVSPEIAGEIAKLNAVVVLPLMLHNDLIGFISLGKKKSDEDYTKDDLDVLLDLARTESVAVGNAQLLQEAAQSERRAAIGTMAAGIHHEIGNPLNIINTKIQVFLTAIQRGFYKEKTKEEIIEECEDILNETINQTNRIADITRRLSNFAKPSKEFKPELVSVPEEIEEALFVVGHELELEKINIKKEVSSDANRILADKHEMQQVLFNIFRNASQAIERTGTITIRVLSTTDGKVHIEIEDTGKGIPEDKIHRIFEPFFTTKGPNKGTGLGLSIVRQLVWRNKGEISFRSQVGVGTTFILEFPKGI